LTKLKKTPNQNKLQLNQKSGQKKLHNIWPYREGSDNEILQKISLKKIYAFIGIWTNGGELSLLDNTKVIEIKPKEILSKNI
jgi:hypothetical protein